MSNDQFSSQELAHLQERFASMPALPRRVLERHRFDGLSLVRIAAELGTDTRSVEQLLAAAMAHIDREQG